MFVKIDRIRNINCKQCIVSQRNIALKSRIANNELLLLLGCSWNNSRNVNIYDHEIYMTPQNFRVPIPNSMGQNFNDYSWNEKIISIQNGVLRDILKEYLDIYSKHKYDVGKMNIGPQRIFLKKIT